MLGGAGGAGGAVTVVAAVGRLLLGRQLAQSIINQSETSAAVTAAAPAAMECRVRGTLGGIMERRVVTLFMIFFQEKVYFSVYFS